MNSTYSIYLSSLAWNNKRQQKLALTNSCEACGERARLHVHHLTYARIFKEEMADLMTLCWLHHAAAEEMIEKGAISRVGDVSQLRQLTLNFISDRYQSKPKLIKQVKPLSLKQRRKLSKKNRAAKKREKFKALMRSQSAGKLKSIVAILKPKIGERP